MRCLHKHVIRSFFKDRPDPMRNKKKRKVHRRDFNRRVEICSSFFCCCFFSISVHLPLPVLSFVLIWYHQFQPINRRWIHRWNWMHRFLIHQLPWQNHWDLFYLVQNPRFDELEEEEMGKFSNLRQSWNTVCVPHVIIKYFHYHHWSENLPRSESLIPMNVSSRPLIRSIALTIESSTSSTLARPSDLNRRVLVPLLTSPAFRPRFAGSTSAKIDFNDGK